MRIDVKNFRGKKDTPTLYKLDKKRFVYTEEPDKDSVLDGHFLKEITGSTIADWRKIYSATSKVLLHFTLFICCNKKPPISSVDDATKNRIIDFVYKSTFASTNVDNVTTFQIDDYFRSVDFRNKYKMCLFYFLLPYLKMFFEQNEIIKLTKNLTERRDKYLRDSDDIYSWFMDRYKITDNSKDIVKMSDVRKQFKWSNYYQNLTKAKKRKLTNSKIDEELLSRKSIKILHKERYSPTVDGKRKNYTNVLIGIKKNVEWDGENMDSDSD